MRLWLPRLLALSDYGVDVNYYDVRLIVRVRAASEDDAFEKIDRRLDEANLDADVDTITLAIL